jgi:membrane associated rhomboid family serine protease
MNSIFANLAPVTKNLLIINVLFFLATFVLEQKGIEFTRLLAAHNPESPLFQPYQVLTHFFMHSGFRHILFNMIGLIVFGSMLERVWKEKRFLIFYLSSALGSFILYMGYSFYEMHELKNAILANNENLKILRNVIVDYPNITQYNELRVSESAQKYVQLGIGSMVGASGAIYGLMVGAAVLFPNTEMMMIFPPIPIKLKYLALIFLAFDIYANFQDTPGDNTAHLAHIGGAITGFIIVKIWNKDKTRFY